MALLVRAEGQGLRAGVADTATLEDQKGPAEEVIDRGLWVIS